MLLLSARHASAADSALCMPTVASLERWARRSAARPGQGVMPRVASNEGGQASSAAAPLWPGTFSNLSAAGCGRVPPYCSLALVPSEQPRCAPQQRPIMLS